MLRKWEIEQFVKVRALNEREKFRWKFPSYCVVALIERLVGYISQAGYKGYLSTVEFTTNDASFNGVPAFYRL